MAVDANAQDWASKRIGIFFPAGLSDNTEGVLTGQCVSLIKWFLAEMCENVPAPFAARGDAKDFGNTLVAQGIADRVGDLKRGDIIVWPYDGGGYGHIGVYMGDGTVFEENVSASGQHTADYGVGTVYSANVSPIDAPWRIGGYNIYRVRSYVENIVRTRDRSAEVNHLNGLYHKVLGRDVDEGAKSHYLKQIDAGWNWQQIEDDLANSQEGRIVRQRRDEEAEAGRKAIQSQIDEINRIYQRVLGREADEEGLKHYRGQIAQGWDYGAIERDLLASEEYRQRQEAVTRAAHEAQARAEAEAKAKAAEEAKAAEAERQNRAAVPEPETPETPAEPEVKEDDKVEENRKLLVSIHGMVQWLVKAIQSIFHIK